VWFTVPRACASSAISRFFGIEEQHAELLHLLARQCRVEIADQPVPVVQHRLLRHLCLHHAQRRGLDELQRRDGVRPQPRALQQLRRRRGHYPGEAAMLVDEPLGERLGVAIPEGEEEQHLQQLVVRERLGPALQQLLPHAAAMALGPMEGKGRRSGKTSASASTANGSRIRPGRHVKGRALSAKPCAP
jgi:hypothetical protein